jgi:hypothetical protein
VLPLRFKGIWFAGGAVLIAAVVVLALTPASELPRTGFGDFAEHAAGYSVLTLWFAGLAMRERWGIVAGALFGLGALLEWLQGALGLGRVSDAADLAANTVGIATALGLAYAGLGGWMQLVEARLARVRPGS